MIRRRRSLRETPFSLDSFLDLVTNVVGIVIRLILVAWVAAKAYTTLPDYLKKGTSKPPEVATPLRKDDPLDAEIERQQRELAEAESRLLDQLKQLDLVQTDEKDAEKELASVALDRENLDKNRKTLEDSKEQNKKGTRAVALSLDELEARRKKLLTELEELEKKPAPTKLLRYRTPVSETVHGGESHFECRGGRVAYIDLESMLAQVVSALHDKEENLRTQWQVNDVTEPVGPFRLQYTVERRRGNVAEAMYPGGAPDGNGNFSYGVSEWKVQPIDPNRGETLPIALSEKSQFRHVIDAMAVERAAVTFWVYPDSFAMYRQLRDYAADRGLTVAGRPLPDGAPIAGAPWGRKSRGQ
jgi:hypothetical protein